FSLDLTGINCYLFYPHIYEFSHCLEIVILRYLHLVLDRFTNTNYYFYYNAEQGSRPMASFSFAYLFILFSSQGICSLCYTEQDVSFNFQQITCVPLVSTSWEVNIVSLFTSIMCCHIISGINSVNL
ncbi:hypothetical protein MKW92_047627, partial [Papaver armeniacum]